MDCGSYTAHGTWKCGGGDVWCGHEKYQCGAVIASAYFPGEVLFPVMIGTLFQQVLAASFGTWISRKKEEGEKKV